MSEFYGAPWFEIQSEAELTPQATDCLVEWRVDVSDLDGIARAQHHGFTLVESVIEFETLVAPVDCQRTGLRRATIEDLAAILALTRAGFVENDAFQNRFKNRDFFSPEQTWAYFEASINRGMDPSEGVCVVYEDNGETLAYYMVRRVTDDAYKGVMTAVDPTARGMRLHTSMQELTFDLIGREVTIINSTQLSNLSTIRSHIRNRRNLSKIEHTFYRRGTTGA